MLAALENVAATAAGRASLIGDAPPSSVCRTCGHLAPDHPPDKVPHLRAWPDTYQRFMPNYWFDALEPAALESLRRTRSTADRIGGRNDGPIMTEGGWAIRNVITHLRDAQQLFDFRLDLFLQEEHPDLEAKAVWTWATQEEERPPLPARFLAEVYRASLRPIPGANWSAPCWLIGGARPTPGVSER